MALGDPRDRKIEEVKAVNDRLASLLHLAIRATEDGETLGAIGAIRRALSAAGSHPNDLKVFREQDGSFADRRDKLLDATLDREVQATRAMHRYMDRLAVLERVFDEMKRLTRHLPAVDRADYRLRFAVESVHLPPEALFDIERMRAREVGLESKERRVITRLIDQTTTEEFATIYAALQPLLTAIYAKRAETS
jgi:hypothetical protein